MRLLAILIIAAAAGGCAMTPEDLQQQGTPYSDEIQGDLQTIFDRITVEARSCVGKSDFVLDIDRIQSEKALIFSVRMKSGLAPMTLVNGRVFKSDNGAEVEAIYYRPTVFDPEIHKRFLDNFKHWSNNHKPVCPYE